MYATWGPPPGSAVNPVFGELTVKRPVSGQVVARPVQDSRGDLRVRLAPGRYVVEGVAQHGNFPPSPAVAIMYKSVVVKASATVRADLVIGVPSGVRVAGTLREDVGLVPARGVSGQVTAVAQDGQLWTTAVKPSGAFLLWLTPGVYHVIGSSPSFNRGNVLCRSIGALTVTPHHAPVVSVVCNGP